MLKIYQCSRVQPSSDCFSGQKWISYIFSLCFLFVYSFSFILLILFPFILFRFRPILIKYYVCKVNTKSNCIMFWKHVFDLTLNYSGHYFGIERKVSIPQFYCRKFSYFIVKWFWSTSLFEEELSAKLAIAFFISWYNLFIKNRFLNRCWHTCHFLFLPGNILCKSFFSRNFFFFFHNQSFLMSYFAFLTSQFDHRHMFVHPNFSSFWALWYHVCFLLSRWVLSNFRNSLCTIFILCATLLWFIGYTFICTIQTSLYYFDTWVYVFWRENFETPYLPVSWRILRVTCLKLQNCLDSFLIV